MEKKINPRRLKGFQDYLPHVMKNRSRIVKLISETAEKRGFLPTGTPVLEYSEVLLGAGEETDKQIFQFEDNGGRNVAMRFDLTVPFARFVAEHQGELNFPFKRYQIGDVWRAEKPQKGRYREFGQCDLDIIGHDSKVADVEVIYCLHRVIGQCGIGAFTMSLGNRQILSRLIQTKCGGIHSESVDQVFIALDKLEKIGSEKVLALLEQIEGVERDEASSLLELLEASVASEDPLSVVAEALNDDLGRQEIERMRFVGDTLQKMTKGSEGAIKIDLRIARGLGYYTGIVFETVIDSLPNFGSISSGGRYNNLADRFSKTELPGVGGSLGLDRLVAAMTELDVLKPSKKADVFIAIATEDAVAYAFEISQRIEELGLGVDISLKFNKVGQQFKVANREEIPFVITVGGSEMEERVLNVKNMNEGTEEKGILLSDLDLSHFAV